MIVKFFQTSDEVKDQPRVFRRPTSTCQHLPAPASLGQPRARTFSTDFVRRQRGIGTSPLLADKSLDQKCATSTKIRHFSSQCPLSADNSIEQNCATSMRETYFSSFCRLMLAIGSTLGHKMPSKICNMSLPRPEMHHLASQHGLPNPQNGPQDGP